MNDQSTDQLVLFGQFIDHYYPSIYSAINKLTGLTDEKEIETITVAVFDELWRDRDQLLNEMRPPAYVYRVLIRHVFSFLRKQGSEDRIIALQNTLLIDPAYYAPGSLPDDDRPGVDPGKPKDA
jgi:DNA-directed RNA polymerase specialized sigma24 family protein